MIDYEAYELEMDLRLGRRAKTLPRRRPAPKEVVVELAQPGDGPVGFNPTFKAAHQDHHEYQWIVHALGGFYADSLINDVLRAVKGGKEASVYCCEAHPAMGVKLLAAKIYRPRIFRNLKNDAPYREGRELLDEEGKGIRDTRRQRALKKRRAMAASWPSRPGSSTSIRRSACSTRREQTFPGRTLNRAMPS